jgi:hypothetical protein
MPNVIGENAAVLVRRNSSNFERRHVIVFVLGLPLPRENAARPSTIASRARGSAAVRLSDRAQPCAPAHAAGVGGDHINRVLEGKDARFRFRLRYGHQTNRGRHEMLLGANCCEAVHTWVAWRGSNLLTVEHIIRANSFSVTSVKAVSRAKASRAASRAILRQNGGRRRVLHSEGRWPQERYYGIPRHAQYRSQGLSSAPSLSAKSSKKSPAGKRAPVSQY